MDVCTRVNIAMDEADVKKGLQRLSRQILRHYVLLIAVAIAVAYAIAYPLLSLFQQLPLPFNNAPFPAPICSAIRVIFIVCIYLFVFQFLLRYSPIKQYLADGILRAPTEIHLDSEGVRISSTYKTAFLRWGGVKKITADKEFIMIYVDAAAAHLVPKRFFSSAQDAETFAKQAQDFMDAAQARAGHPASPHAAAQHVKQSESHPTAS